MFFFGTSTRFKEMGNVAAGIPGRHPQGERCMLSRTVSLVRATFRSVFGRDWWSPCRLVARLRAGCQEKALPKRRGSWDPLPELKPPPVALRALGGAGGKPGGRVQPCPNGSYAIGAACRGAVTMKVGSPRGSVPPSAHESPPGRCMQTPASSARGVDLPPYFLVTAVRRGGGVRGWVN